VHYSCKLCGGENADFLSGWVKTVDDPRRAGRARSIGMSSTREIMETGEERGDGIAGRLKIRRMRIPFP
jgi:hypothetical protein